MCSTHYTCIMICVEMYTFCTVFEYLSAILYNINYKVLFKKAMRQYLKQHQYYDTLLAVAEMVFC